MEGAQQAAAARHIYRVASDLFFAEHPGDIVCFDLHPGRLGGKWFRAVPCLDPER